MGARIKKMILRLCVMACALTGCGGSDKLSESERIKLEQTYVKEKFQVTGENVEAQNMRVQGDKIYTMSEDEKDGSFICQFHVMGLDGSDYKEVTTLNLNRHDDIYNFAVDEQGDIHYLQYLYSDKKFYLVTMDVAGKEKERVDITDELGDIKKEDMRTFLCDGNGNYYIPCGTMLYILDSVGKKQNKVDARESIDYIGMTKSGAFLYASVESDGCSTVKVLDIAKGEFTDSYTIGAHSDFGGFASMEGEYDFYYTDNSGFYGYDMEAKKMNRIINLHASGLSIQTQVLASLGETEFIALDLNYDTRTFECFKLKKGDVEQLQNKKTIILGKLDLNALDQWMEQAIIEFNTNSMEYKIELRDYGLEEDPNLAFNKDVASGDVPDIMFLNDWYGDTYIRQFTQLGMLEDLKPYFEKDEDISLDDLMDVVVDVWDEDGSIYYIDTEFGVWSLAIDEKIANGKTGWNIQEFLDLADGLTAEQSMFDEESCNWMLEKILVNVVHEYVDWKTGEVTINCEDFRNLLAFYKQERIDDNVYIEDGVQREPILFRNGEIKVCEYGAAFFSDFLYYTRRFGTDVSLIGYPSEDKNGYYLGFNNPMGIYSQSKVKDGAWEFLKMILSKEKQYGIGRVMFPVRKDVFEMELKAATTTERYTDEYGTQVNPLNWSGDGVDYTPMTDKEVEMLMHIINNTHKASFVDITIKSILDEEVEAYIAGDITVDEAVERINDRVSKYVNENR